MKDMPWEALLIQLGQLASGQCFVFTVENSHSTVLVLIKGRSDNVVSSSKASCLFI